MQPRRLKRRLGRLLQRVLTAVLVAGPVALIALWLALQHKPGWYQPATLDDAGIQRARSQTIEVADRVSDQMVEGQPFDVVLDEQSVNVWLAALPHIWPRAGDALPRELSNPAVRFDDGLIRVGAYYAVGGWRAIVSVVLKLGISEDGTAIEVGLSNLRGGSLPVPRMILPTEVISCQLSVTDNCQLTTSSDVCLQELFAGKSPSAGVRIINRFVWFNGDRPFSIDSLRLGDGELRLTIRPL